MVDERVGGHCEVVVERLHVGFGRDARLYGSPHVVQPGVAFGLADAKAEMAHAQTWMAQLRDVRRRSAPVLRQEQRQMALRRSEIVGVQRPQQRIRFDALIEAVDERHEERVAADPLVQASLRGLEWYEHWQRLS